jgi:hypothetical protein
MDTEIERTPFIDIRGPGPREPGAAADAGTALKWPARRAALALDAPNALVTRRAQTPNARPGRTWCS